MKTTIKTEGGLVEVTGTHYSVEVQDDLKPLDLAELKGASQEDTAEALMEENKQLKEQLEQAQNDAGVYKEKYMECW